MYWWTDKMYGLKEEFTTSRFRVNCRFSTYLVSISSGGEQQQHGATTQQHNNKVPSRPLRCGCDSLTVYTEHCYTALLSWRLLHHAEQQLSVAPVISHTVAPTVSQWQQQPVQGAQQRGWPARWCSQGRRAAPPSAPTPSRRTCAASARTRSSHTQGQQTTRYNQPDYYAFFAGIGIQNPVFKTDQSLLLRPFRCAGRHECD